MYVSHKVKQDGYDCRKEVKTLISFCVEEKEGVYPSAKHNYIFFDMGTKKISLTKHEKTYLQACLLRHAILVEKQVEEQVEKQTSNEVIIAREFIDASLPREAVEGTK